MTALDVEAARKVLLDSLPPRDPKWRIWVDGVLDRLAPCVEYQTINRTVLELWLREHLGGGQAIRAEGLADGILALARPVDGITLTPEEAATAAACVRAASRVAYMRDDLAALAARLEASS